MPYNEFLADRVRLLMQEKRVGFFEKKIFGGLVFMVDDKMCVGIMKDELMVRIDPDLSEEALRRKGCSLMDFTGASMKGFMMIDLEGADMDADLEYWVQLALDYNPRAKATKKK
jgi:TfoX/Sxy family transcriptional regulator of competence genes